MFVQFAWQCGGCGENAAMLPPCSARLLMCGIQEWAASPIVDSVFRSGKIRMEGRRCRLQRQSRVLAAYRWVLEAPKQHIRRQEQQLVRR